jgi:hypothetical protein
MKKVTYDPFYKPAVAYRSAITAFRDAEYASWLEKPELKGISPFLVAVLFTVLICATILFSNFLE